MIGKTLQILALTGIVLAPGNLLWAQEFPQVRKENILIPSEEYVEYKGPYIEAFPQGFPIGIGSGMCYIGTDKEGNHLFFAVADRGPNADGPKFLDISKGETRPSKIFPAPHFIPRYGVIGVTPEKAELLDTTLLRSFHNDVTTGLPLPPGLVGSTGEVPLTETLEVQPFSPSGLDLEGVDIDPKDGSLWMCDEYGPFILHVERDSGRILRKYAPGEGLPEILALRQPNRGFEGIAVTPEGKVVAVVQSILDVDGKVKKSKAPFIRLLVLDPATGKTFMYAYPHDVQAYKRSRDAKIGDLCAVDNHRFLLVEQGKGTEGLRNMVYLVDLEGATDISGIKTSSGEPLEKVQSLEDLKELGVREVAKTLLLNLRDLGWKPGKAEGIDLLPCGKTMVVCSDNDFGLCSSLADSAQNSQGKTVKSIKDYTTSGSGNLQVGEAPTHAQIVLEATGEDSQIWFITLEESLFKKK